MKTLLITIVVLALFSGCISGEEAPDVTTPDITAAPIPTLTPTPTPSPTETAPSETPVTNLEDKVQGFDGNSHAQSYENKSVAVEVDYRKYVDWFRNHNLFIRSYTPLEYVCGQYTVDMINDSKEAGFNAYFAAVTFTDGSGHALVSFKSTYAGMPSSWYFFEPQNNKLMTPETIEQVLNRAMGKKVEEVNIYGYFDDAGDTDPTSWRFAYPLYNRKY
ncbi:MAG: hypothetical protein OIN89_02130 [Candidatus Methanoperedens sp.]|nr:hypothetical protein [Candidatus Methanoperedens sp.]PKL54393.1 MAG: hypothetical protein CVV36_02080 [Candidatus Methanoperedenaceae archaeon HGW-Methanoperedenaceae-1]